MASDDQNSRRPSHASLQEDDSLIPPNDHQVLQGLQQHREEDNNNHGNIDTTTTTEQHDDPPPLPPPEEATMVHSSPSISRVAQKDNSKASFRSSTRTVDRSRQKFAFQEDPPSPSTVPPEATGEATMITSLPSISRIAQKDHFKGSSRSSTRSSTRTADRSHQKFAFQDDPEPPPSTVATNSIGSLPPVFLENPNSRNSIMAGRNSTAGSSNASVSSSSYRSDAAMLAIAERVASSSAILSNADDDLESIVEERVRERAYQIARNVLDEIREHAVQAVDVATVGEDTITTGTEQRQGEHGTITSFNNQSVLVAVQRRRLRLLLGLVALLVAAVIALVAVLATKNGKNSTTIIKSAQPPVASCSFCFGGAPTTNDMASLQNTHIWSNPDRLTCADLLVYQQNVSSTDPSCPGLQALTFKYCGCRTLPPRPQNASCTMCPNGAIPTGSSYCTKADTYVAIFGASLFYDANCADLANAELHTNGCTCPNVTGS